MSDKNQNSKESQDKAAADAAAAAEKEAQEKAAKEQADAAAAAADKEAKAGKKPASAKYPARARVRTTTGGVMRHLLTNEEIGPSEKKIDIDEFAIAQLDAGKWEIVTD